MFEEHKRVLHSVSQDTENEFIAFGKEAEALFSEARTVLTDVNGVLETITGSEAQKVVDLFESLVRDAAVLITEDNSEVESLIHEMSGLRRQIGTLSSHRVALNEAVRLPFTILKMGFRIEGTHRNKEIAKILDGVGLEASILGKQVTCCIDAQFAALHDAASHMDQLMSGLGGMSKDAQRQHDEASIAIRQLRSHTGNLKEAHLARSNLGNAIAVNGRELQQEFNRVVMALQYHDITRQQLEHVAQAFESMQESLPSENSSFDPPVAVPEDFLHSAVLVQIQQTEAALGSLQAAGREFQRGMENISRLANELTQNVAIFRNLCQAENVFRALDGLAALQSVIVSRSTIKRQVGEAGCEIFTKVKDFTTTMDEVTLDLRILAINAHVQAANANHQQVVEVLAKSMCQVSSTIKSQAELLTLDMRAIIEGLSSLATRAWKLGTEQTPEGRAMREGVPRCIASQKTIQEKVTAGLDIVDRRQQELQSRIEHMLSRVHFPEVAAQRLQTVLRFFASLREQTRPSGDSPDISVHAFANLEKRYSMASEREIHALALKRTGTPQEIQVASRPAAFSDVPLQDPATTPEPEFDDSVELF